MAQRCSAPGCAAESKFACSRCHAAFYCGAPCQRAHWRAHKPGCAAAAPAPTAAAQGGGAGAGAGSGGGGSADECGAGRGGEKARTFAQRCCAPGCTAEGNFACLVCRAVFYCGEPCQRAHWRAHRPSCAVADAAPTAAAQGGGAGAGAGSEGGGSAAPASAPPSKRLVYTGLEQVVEDPRCGKCGKDLSHRGKECEEEHLACGACRKVPYCDMVCLESHYLGHMEECFEVIAARVLAGDVHKDDTSGEYVLKDYVGECTAKYGALDERTLGGQRVYGVFLKMLGRLEEAKVLLLAAQKG
jgi:hypothetical protein